MFVVLLQPSKQTKQEVEFNHIKQQQVDVVIHCDTQTPLLSYMKR
jgi:hypothetical protein